MRHDYFKIICKLADGNFKYEKCDYLRAIKFYTKDFELAKLFGGVKSATIYNISKNNEIFAQLS